MYPNAVKFNKKMSFKDYISTAGGFSSEAKVGSSYIIYANGRGNRTKDFLLFKKFPPVNPGSDILVPKKLPRRRLTATEIIGISSGLASLSFIILQLVDFSN